MGFEQFLTRGLLGLAIISAAFGIGSAQAADLSVDLVNLVNALNAVPESELRAVAKRLQSKSQYAHLNSRRHSAIAFGNSLLSCGVRKGAFVFAKEGQCSWARVSINRLDRDGGSGAPGLEKKGYNISAGLQVKLVDEWRLGFALGYENTFSEQFFEGQNLDEITGNILSLGAVVKSRSGPLSAALFAHASHGLYDSKRFVNLANVADNAFSDQSVSSFSTGLRLSALFGSKSIYMKPMLDLSAQWIYLDGYTEKGAAGANLVTRGASHWYGSIAPALEIGAELASANGNLWRPYLRGGMRVFDHGSLQFSSRFIVAPTGVVNLAGNAVDLEQYFGEIEAGVNVLTAKGMDLKFSYEGRYGEYTRSHSGNLK